jgi:RimJ/RimL family protein N-acetyltransferase
MCVLRTDRLELVPITLPMVEAVFRGAREEAEAIAGARLPEAWPGAALIERAFTASLEDIRRDPERRLWGDRLMILRENDESLIIGSVVFHGLPDDGVAEVAYGVEQGRQSQGYATEATRAAVVWALAEPGIVAVRATTATWHRASLRVIEKIGMRLCGTREHDMLGELLVFERRRAQAESEEAQGQGEAAARVAGRHLHHA